MSVNAKIKYLWELIKNDNCFKDADILIISKLINVL